MRAVSIILAFVVASVFCATPPPGSVIPCEFVYLRGINCTYDMVCGTFDLKGSLNPQIPEESVTIPTGGGAFPLEPPADPTKSITWNLVGFDGSPFNWPLSNGVTEFHIFWNSPTASTSDILGIRIRYDYGGDGIWDKTEVTRSVSDTDPVSFQDSNVQITAANTLFSNGTAGYSTFLDGKIDLTLWTNLGAANGIQVKVSKQSYIRLPYQATFQRPRAIVSDVCNITSTTAPTQGKVAFFLDSLQDFFQGAAINAVMDVFESRNLSLTVGVITSALATDAALINRLTRSQLPTSVWELEVACNGHANQAYDARTYQQQLADLSSCKSTLKSRIGTEPKTLIPSYAGGTFGMNTFTLKALQDSGYTHFANRLQYDVPPYANQKSRLFRFPANTFTTTGQSAATIFSSIQTQMTTYGFAVVSMSPADFGGGNVVNASIQTLISVINSVRSAGYQVVPVQRLNFDAVNISRTQLPTCNCVAFRLDDIQDYFLVNSQKAVMSVFAELAVPLTVGVIGSFTGTAPANTADSIVSSVSDLITNSSTSPCFDFELANHGWLHEDFSALSTAQQQSALIQSQTRINSLFTRTPKVFIPPFNLFNAFTYPILRGVGFTHMSSETTSDPGPFDYNNLPSGIYPFPIAASTSNYLSTTDYFGGVSATITMNQILDQIKNFGWASVMMHPQEFANRYPNGSYVAPNIVNTTQILELRTLLTMVKAQGLRACTLSKIQNFFFNTTRDPCLGPPPTTTAQPTTAVATTAQPTTAVPTTAVPTTAIPTTAVPTTAIIPGSTAAPTTAVPTTAVASTAQPTTAVASTAQPTTAVASTARPTTAVGVVTTGSATTRAATTGVAATTNSPTTAESTVSSAVSVVLSLALLIASLLIFA